MGVCVLVGGVMVEVLLEDAAFKCDHVTWGDPGCLDGWPASSLASRQAHQHGGPLQQEAGGGVAVFNQAPAILSDSRPDKRRPLCVCDTLPSGRHRTLGLYGLLDDIDPVCGVR